MKILFINVVCGIKSTGRICTDLAEDLIKQGHDVKIAYGRGTVPEKYKDISVRIGTDIDVLFHALGSKLFDKCGYGSKRATKKFIRWAEGFDPDVLWLHNIHDHYINIFYLFDWIKTRPDMKVKWTQHDCWAFTGGCPYFTMSRCEQWKKECFKCPSKHVSPKRVLLRNPNRNYHNKRLAFSGVENMELITPSKWLKELIEESFLNKYNTEVIYNKIDTGVFVKTKSDFKLKHGIENKIMILGVAVPWSERKGLDDFVKLQQIIDDRFRIVLVGLNDKQIKSLPKKIIGIKRTNSVEELVKIYSAADVFLNLTYEDNYPTVNLEAIACGTPCITYNTGGSPESVPKENVIEVGNIEQGYSKIKDMFKGIL